jgi:hypothetical protein
MQWRDFIASEADVTRVSHTKVWSNVAYLAATVVFILQAYKGSLTSDVWFIYLGIVGAHTAASKAMSLKYNTGGAVDVPVR